MRALDLETRISNALDNMAAEAVAMGWDPAVDVYNLIGEMRIEKVTPQIKKLFIKCATEKGWERRNSEVFIIPLLNA